MEIEQQVNFYAEIFGKALSRVGYVDAAIMITQEIGHDLRQAKIPNKFEATKSIDKKTEYATPKQMIALKKHNLWKDGLTKTEATQIIKESIERNY